MGLALCILIYCACGAIIQVFDKRQHNTETCLAVMWLWLPTLCHLAYLKKFNPKAYYAIPME